jgi:hypothetical protein
MLACRLLGHRPRFWTDGEVMHWSCERDCGFEGSKQYASPAEASRYAGTFDREDSDALGRRPIIAMWPLRWARRRKGSNAPR